MSLRRQKCSGTPCGLFGTPFALMPTRGITTCSGTPCGCQATSLIITFLLALFLLAACGGSNMSQVQKPTPTPSPTPGPGQQLLAKVAQNLNTAKTLHGIFDLTITGQTLNGTVETEIWNALPNKNRSVILKSSIVQVTAGSVTVTDGKQTWQYDPVKKVVYTGPVTSNGTSANGGIFNTGNGQSQLVLGLVQSVFTNSKATLTATSANINGSNASDVHVVSQGQTVGSEGGNFNYDGEVYIDKATDLPLKVNLNIQRLGQIEVDFPELVLNQPIPASTFTFEPPAGVKILPLQQASATPSTGSISLAQAQQQAGYHLLSIPASQTGYQLESVNALGAPGSQIFTLNYIKGNTSFTIAEGKSLANLPNSSGQQVSIRAMTGMLSTASGSTTLAWTENGVGIRITGPLSNDQVIGIAKLLS